MNGTKPLDFSVVSSSEILNGRGFETLGKGGEGNVIDGTTGDDGTIGDEATELTTTGSGSRLMGEIGSSTGLAVLCLPRTGTKGCCCGTIAGLITEDGVIVGFTVEI